MGNPAQALFRLWRALERSAAAAGCTVTLIYQQALPWASATFTGARHKIMVASDTSAGLAAWVDQLEDADFNLPGHLVADLSVGRIEKIGTRSRVAIEALTVEQS